MSDAFHDDGIKTLDGNNTNESLNAEFINRGLNTESPIVPRGATDEFVPPNHDCTTDEP